MSVCVCLFNTRAKQSFFPYRRKDWMISWTDGKCAGTIRYTAATAPKSKTQCLWVSIKFKFVPFTVESSVLTHNGFWWEKYVPKGMIQALVDVLFQIFRIFIIAFYYWPASFFICNCTKSFLVPHLFTIKSMNITTAAKTSCTFPSCIFSDFVL